MKIHSINTGNFKLDGGAMFGVVPKSIWNRTNPADQNNLCDWAMRNGIPILGVCHGAFFLNYAFKGIDAEIVGHRGKDHTVTMEGEEHTVNSYHDICIYELGQDLKPVAWTDDHVEAFKHKELPIWGIVWHPERMDDPVLPKEIKDLLDV